MTSAYLMNLEHGDPLQSFKMGTFRPTSSLGDTTRSQFFICQFIPLSTIYLSLPLPLFFLFQFIRESQLVPRGQNCIQPNVCGSRAASPALLANRRPSLSAERTERQFIWGSRLFLHQLPMKTQSTEPDTPLQDKTPDRPSLLGLTLCNRQKHGCINFKSDGFASVLILPFPFLCHLHSLQSEVEQGYKMKPKLALFTAGLLTTLPWLCQVHSCINLAQHNYAPSNYNLVAAPPEANECCQVFWSCPWDLLQ